MIDYNLVLYFGIGLIVFGFVLFLISIHFERQAEIKLFKLEQLDKAFISKNGVVCFIYWDCDAEPDEKGNQWRMAKNPMTIKATTTIEG